MTDQSPADTIRRAIHLLRTHAEAATPGPWVSLGGGDRLIRQHDDVDDTDGFDYVVDEPMSNSANAAYIALMNPLVAASLADWLAAELLVHEQAGALAAAATSGEVHIGGSVARMEVGLSTLDKALAVAVALTGPEVTE